MDDFSTPGTRNSFNIPASPSNYIRPKKMPMSSMCPSIILNDNNEVVYVTGASGGTRITTAVAWVVNFSFELFLLLQKMHFFLFSLLTFVTLFSLLLKTTLQSLWFKKRVDYSLDEPRLHHQLVPNDLVAENYFSENVERGLKLKGHKIRKLTGRQGVVQACHKICDDQNKNCLTGASDGRKGGVPDGF